MSWMIFKAKIQGEYVDRRHFCVTAVETLAQLDAFLGRRRVCFTQRIVIVLPGQFGGNVYSVQKMFNTSWKAGIMIVEVVVVSESSCREFSIVPSEETGSFWYAPRFALTHSWKRSQSCSSDDSEVKYFSEYKISGLNKCNIDVFASKSTLRAWSALLNFLEFTMDARFNTTTIGETFPSYKNNTPSICAANLLLTEYDVKHYIVPSYIKIQEKVYVGPRELTVSVEWFRILNELSGNVWFALIVISLLSAGTLYLLAKDGKDFVYVILFTVQPLFEKSWEGHFLSWRGRMFFTLWLFFCVILTTSYTSTFLSKLNVPPTTDAIKSFDDLVKSSLPVYAHMHKKVAKFYKTLPLFQPIINRTTFQFEHKKLPKKRHNVAHLITKSDSHDFPSTSYRLLPEIVHISYTTPLEMTRLRATF